jgi:hypothetical protein
VWELPGKLDLSKFTGPCRSRGENAGRPAADPRILAALWLDAASRGVGSARELARLCRDHAAYRWICGGVEVSRRALSDFRVGHGQALDALLTEVPAVLMHQDLLPLARTVQDGMKVRASAGAASFHRQPTLEKCRKEAEEPLERLKAEPDAAPQDAVRKAARRDRRNGERPSQMLSRPGRIQSPGPSQSRLRGPPVGPRRQHPEAVRPDGLTPVLAARLEKERESASGNRATALAAGPRGAAPSRKPTGNRNGRTQGPGSE